MKTTKSSAFKINAIKNRFSIYSESIITSKVLLLSSSLLLLILLLLLFILLLLLLLILLLLLLLKPLHFLFTFVLINFYHCRCKINRVNLAIKYFIRVLKKQALISLLMVWTVSPCTAVRKCSLCLLNLLALYYCLSDFGFTKFCVLHPLTPKRAAEVAFAALLGSARHISSPTWCSLHAAKWQWFRMYCTCDHWTERNVARVGDGPWET